MIKKLLLLLFLCFSLNGIAAETGHYVYIYLVNGAVDSIAAQNVYDIHHSRTDLYGKEHTDYVTLVLKTLSGDKIYPLIDVQRVVTPNLWHTITLNGGMMPKDEVKRQRRISIHGGFPGATNLRFQWEPIDSIAIHMGKQDTVYNAKIFDQEADSVYAYFKFNAKGIASPMTVYYSNNTEPKNYNQVRILAEQNQPEVDDSKHLGSSGDCASAEATLAKDNQYNFVLNHWPAYFVFLTHNKRLPSVKLKKITMIADKPIAGTFNYSDPSDNADKKGGIDLNSVKNDASKTITLTTPYFYKGSHRHLPREYKNSQDSAAAYMVVAPQTDLKFYLRFEVEDTLSLIDTVFVQHYHVSALKANHIYTINAEIPDTLFSIVDLGLGDVKYAYRNVEAFFERGPVNYYGGAFSYGESNTKNSYEPGGNLSNYHGGSIQDEFTEKYDAAYQRWQGKWRMMQNIEADSLLKRCTSEWTEYNGVHGALLTGPSGKRIFLPVNDKFSRYWSIDRSKKISDFYKVDMYGNYTYYNIPCLGIGERKTPVLYQDSAYFYMGGFCRPVIEYSNEIKSGSTFDHTLMLLRHEGEKEVKDKDGNRTGDFTINGIIRNTRPWPTAATVLTASEVGFVFGTDSTALYMDKNVTTATWDSTYFANNGEKEAGKKIAAGKLQLKLKDTNYDGDITVDAYKDKPVSVNISNQLFIPYIDKTKKYFVREYAVVGGKTYYASTASAVSGFFPHTDRVGWEVGDATATLRGHLTGVSSNVIGQPGFVVSDSVFENPTVAKGKFYECKKTTDTPYGYKDDLTFSYEGFKGLDGKGLNAKKYYFVRGVLFTVKKVKQGDKEVNDTTFYYAPEVKIFHPLDTIDIGLSIKFANENVGCQYPEDGDSTYAWNSSKNAVPDIITDIAGTEHDITYRKWYGEEGWTFGMPSKEVLQAIKDSCTFKIVTRFGQPALKVTGPNSKSIYLPEDYDSRSGYYFCSMWSGQRSKGQVSKAYRWRAIDLELSPNLTDLEKYHYWVRPVYLVNRHLSDGSPLFVSTDTAGVSTDRKNIQLWGRILGITPTLKKKNCVRGFVLLPDEKKYGTLKDADEKTAFDIHKANTETQFNGLYEDSIPEDVRKKLDGNKNYWYRAYIKIGDETRYGDPKLIEPLTITIDDLLWEVHANSATLQSKIVGTIFIKDASTAKTGFVVGKTSNISLDTDKSPIYYSLKTGETLKDSTYSCTMSVPKDTVYWVRAFIQSDGGIRYSEPRQFGLDYVDLGLPSHTLWANISVGTAYPEGEPDYFSRGETATKKHYVEPSYIGDEKRVTDPALYTDGLTTLNDSVILKTLKVPNTNGTTTYDVPYRGAVLEFYPGHFFIDKTPNDHAYPQLCHDPAIWKHYSGTKNDAAYTNWENDNPKFKENKDNKYIENTKYGDLFVEPNVQEWRELRDNCNWTVKNVNGVSGYEVTSKANGNSIFLPFRGYRFDYGKDEKGLSQYVDTLYQDQAAGYYPAADSVLSVSIAEGYTLKADNEFDTPDDNVYSRNYYLSFDRFYSGFPVRPVARFNKQLTNDQKKLADNTLVYLATDTVTYLNYRTAVMLQGTYRINKPLTAGSYELGFVVGTATMPTVGKTDGFSAKATLRNGSQYFLVADKDNKLKSDQLYYYRFYLKDGDQYYYGEPDTFRLAKPVTGKADWQMYDAKATLHGTVQGVMPTEAASGYKAGIIVGYDRKLTYDNALDTYTRETYSSSTSDKNGPVSIEFKLTKDTTYYFRTYQYYDGKYHYGDVNAFGCEFVDLGLPSGVKWASTNVGGYNANTGANWRGVSLYYGISTSTDKDGKTIVTPFVTNSGSGGPADHAHTEWHGVNRMPNHTEYEELANNCTWTPDTLYGCPGWRLTGKNGKSIFLRRHIEREGYHFKIANSMAPNPGGYYFDKELIWNESDYFEPRLMTTDKTADKNRYADVFQSHTAHYIGCYGIYFNRPIEKYHAKLPNGDKLWLSADSIFTPKDASSLTFFGSVLGLTQQHLGGEKYTQKNIDHVGFVIGTDTLTTHKEHFKYDFPKSDIKNDSVLFYTQQNINLFKPDTTYWIRTYVLIDSKYYYGNAVKFVRRPQITTGNVEWAVGRQKAVLHGSVTGFNSDVVLNANDDKDKDEVTNMSELSKKAKFGFLVGWKDNLTPGDTINVKTNGVKMYTLGQAVNGDYSVTVPYDRDTTYYYRAFVMYPSGKDNQYLLGQYTNHFGLEFVDLGLPMQWANISVGGRFAEDKDSTEQIAWGDTIANAPYTFNNYKYYFATGDTEYDLGNEIKATPHDAAHVRWNYTWDAASAGGRGQLWSMPSADDLQMLVDSCEWTDSVGIGLNGREVPGYKVKGPNGKSIFISKTECTVWPISGSSRDTGKETGPMWSSSRASSERNAYGMVANTVNRLERFHYRYHGHFVRPIAYIDVKLSNGKKLSLTTERTSWTAGDEGATIYGTALGVNGLSSYTTGFEVAKTSDFKEAEKHQCQVSAANGLMQYTFKKIDNTRKYYYRSYITVDGKTYYGQTKDFGMEMVDLGLTSGTLWANVNMGAWKNSEHGNFYSWGETVDKDVYDSLSYKYYNSKKNSYEYIGTNIAGNDSTDVAQAKLGGLWRMPTDAEWKELIDECTWEKATVNRVNGYLVKSKKNNNSIFLPTNYYNSEDRDANFYQATNETKEKNHDDDLTSQAYYWSSTRSANYKQAREVTFNTGSKAAIGAVGDNYRWRGNAIRPVVSKNAGNAWIKTTGTDWTYSLPTDSMNLYATVINQPSGYRTFFLIGTTPDLSTSTTGNIADVQARTLTQHNSISYATLKDYLKDGKLKKDGVYYYRAYTCKYDASSNEKSDIHLSTESRQFGLTAVNLGKLSWANINVGAVSPEEIGLNGSEAVSSEDLAHKYYGGSWRLPTEAEKEALLTDCNWTETTLYGVKGWRVANKDDDSKWIFLASKDPSTWGLRAVMETNVTIDGNNAFLRTDNGGWRAGYNDALMKATLVGAGSAKITERGFLFSTTNNPTTSTTGVQTITATQTAEDGFYAPLPTVSLGTSYYLAYVKTASGGITYAPASVAVGLNLVDLGLPSGLQWANMNIGSADSNDSGYDYAWADTTAATTFSSDTYRYAGQDLGTDISSVEKYDVAAKRLGVVRMPGQADFQELIDNCSFTPVTNTATGALIGYTVKNKNGGDASIFLPVGNYWASTSVTGTTAKAYDFSNNSSKSIGQSDRWNGFMIRPVGAAIATLEPQDVKTTTATLRGAVYLSTYTSTTVGFELSDTVSMENATKEDVTVSANGTYKFDLTGLNDGTPYYYRAYYTVGGVTKYGVTKRFVTASTEGAPEAVDLGLSVKWGDRNVNAKLPEKVGDKYGWGETITRLNYTKVTYSYNKNDQYLNIGTNISATTYDVARAKLSGCWRMPTQAEMSELLTKCSWTRGTKDGVSGYWVENKTKRNARSIFLPATGYQRETSVLDATMGYYWTATAANATYGSASALSFTTTGDKAINLNEGNQRFYGYAVRPVYESNTTLGGKDYLIRTDSASNVVGGQQMRLYGTMLGMTADQASTTEGFVIGTTKNVTTANPTIDVHQTATDNGAYSLALSDEDLKKFAVGQTYYLRAYVTLGTETAYGDAIQMVGNTFVTDSVQWTLGNEATFYGSVKAAKSEGLEVGFRYSDNAKMENAKSVTAAFLTTGNTDVFTAKIDTVHLQTYYVQAYTKLNGTTYTTNIISFGAKAVDLGLPSGVKWVDMNLGTNNERQTGDKYKWSELTPNTANFTPSQDAAIGGTANDVAHRRLGAQYRMPSWDNLKELVNPAYTTWTWEVDGYRVTSKTNGNTIFIPAGTYWGSILDANNDLKAHALRVDATGYYADDEEERTSQLLIRGILNTKADVIKGADAGGGTVGGGVEGNE